MSVKYDFSKQAEVFEIAIQIISDYRADVDWSFGGGTALSVAYYNHRMSYDIDIFVESNTLVNILTECRKDIVAQLDIDEKAVQASPGGITFILDDQEAKIKLDFVVRAPVTEHPYVTLDILRHSGIKIQTPEEIIARKIKYRTDVTVRDYVDFYFAQKNDQIFTKCINEHIVDIERFIDIINQFRAISQEDFDLELLYMNIDGITTKSDIEEEIFTLLDFQETIQIAYDQVGEIVAFDSYIEEYRDGYTSRFFDEYNVKTINRKVVEDALGINGRRLNFSDIFGIDIKKIENMSKHDLGLKKL